MIDIINLRDDPDNLLMLATWHQQEWSYLNPGEDIKQRIARMQAYLNQNFIPGTFIAKDKTLLGSAAIVEQDMETEPQLTPWLASVYVRPESRRQGIGKRLVTHAMDQAIKHNVHRLYLYTPDRQDFYLGLGWKSLRDERYQEHDVTIMYIDLDNSRRSL